MSRQCFYPQYYITDPTRTKFHSFLFFNPPLATCDITVAVCWYSVLTGQSLPACCRCSSFGGHNSTRVQLCLGFPLAARPLTHQYLNPVGRQYRHKDRPVISWEAQRIMASGKLRRKIKLIVCVCFSENNPIFIILCIYLVKN